MRAGVRSRAFPRYCFLFGSFSSGVSWPGVGALVFKARGGLFSVEVGSWHQRALGVGFHIFAILLSPALRVSGQPCFALPAGPRQSGPCGSADVGADGRRQAGSGRDQRGVQCWGHGGRAGTLRGWRRLSFPRSTALAGQEDERCRESSAPWAAPAAAGSGEMRRLQPSTPQ